MSDDFTLFDRAGDKHGFEPDLGLITAYLARELSPVQISAVQQRLDTDAAFCQRVRPVIEAWVVPGSYRAEAALRAPLGFGRGRLTRFTPARIAATILLATIPLIGIAQGIRYLLRESPPSSVGVPVPGGTLPTPLGGDAGRARASALGVIPRASASDSIGPLTTAVSAPPAVASRDLPARLSDPAFWQLITDFSEASSGYAYENLTSNELGVAQAVSALRARRVNGGVYLGVGPEQNFSYIAAIRPEMAFIVDIRRQAVIQHLMYKAIFELARDRADFISLLFSKPRPAGLDSTTDIRQMWRAFQAVPTDPVMGARNYRRVEDRLLETHAFGFRPIEVDTLRHIWSRFLEYGPGISYSTPPPPPRPLPPNAGVGPPMPTFVELTSAVDTAGQPAGFLASEADFRFVKSLHERNLIVPVSGDFAGPRALLAIGDYLRERNAAVTAFYVSNVEQHMFGPLGRNVHMAFYANVSTLPVGPGSILIRSPSDDPRMTPLFCNIGRFIQAVEGRRVPNYAAAAACGR